MQMRIAIVGAGWAGMACAIAAASAGAQVDVYEALPALASRHQAVAIAPNLVRDLATLGVAERCVRGGFPYLGLTLTDAAGHPRTELPFARLAGPGLPAAMGLRADLLSAALHDAAQAHGARFHWATAVQALAADSVRYQLSLAGGALVVPDLAVLAGGADMDIAGLPFAPRTRTPEVTWWGSLVNRPAGLDQPQLVLAAQGRKVWLVPVSGASAGLWLIDTGRAASAPAALDVAQARGWLRAQGGSLKRMADLLKDVVALQPLRVRAGLRPEPWTSANLLCVGDAAHVLPHHLSQSPAQAIEDAVVLGALVTHTPDPFALARAFGVRRQPRVRAVFDLATRAAQWDLAPDGHAGIDDLSAALAHAIAPAA